jgi:hypothetical protein
LAFTRSIGVLRRHRLQRHHRDNPEHRQIIEFFRPIVAERAAIQYEF